MRDQHREDPATRSRRILTDRQGASSHPGG